MYDYDLDDYGADRYEDAPDPTYLSVAQVRARIALHGFYVALDMINASYIDDEQLADLWLQAQENNAMAQLFNFLQEDGDG